MKVNLFLHSEDLNLYFVYINLLWNSICPCILRNGSITSQDLIVKRWNFWNSLAVQWFGLHASSIGSSGDMDICSGTMILQATEGSPPFHPSKKKKRSKGVLKLWKMISPEVTDKLIYTQSAKNCWSQYLGEDSSPPEKVPACGAEWLILTPVTLPPTFPSVLLY